jgi:hypothetical protein
MITSSLILIFWIIINGPRITTSVWRDKSAQNRNKPDIDPHDEALTIDPVILIKFNN